jgi:signal transduction histidine kinase
MDDSRASTVNTSAAQLDADAIVRTLQTLSSAIVLPDLIEKLMRLAVEHAGADRGVLILVHGGQRQIEAEAAVRDGAIDITVRKSLLTSADLPLSVVQSALRTGERIVRNHPPDSGYVHDEDEEYLRRRRPRSLLCLPILKEKDVIGALYLENAGTVGAFTADRVAALSYIAGQAAISLENARLYADLRRNEAMLAEAQHLSETGSFIWRVATDEFVWSAQNHRIFDLDPSMPVTFDAIASRMHEEDRPVCAQTFRRARSAGGDLDCRYRLRLPDGTVKHVHMRAHARFDKDGALEYVGAVQDVSHQRRSDDAINKLQSELTHVSRVTSLGVLTASIAHEINQPLAALLTNAGTCLRMLSADPPDVQGAIERTQRTIRSGERASDVVARLRALFAKDGPPTERVDLNEATREVVALSMSELHRSRVFVRTELAEELPAVIGDRVQLQQVILNLMLNARYAMEDIDDRPRVVIVRTFEESPGRASLAVQDAGVGLESETHEKLFDPFFTTKVEGMGIGLSVSRSIIERHGGRMWAVANDGPGATFCFSVPCGSNVASTSFEASANTVEVDSPNHPRSS